MRYDSLTQGAATRANSIQSHYRWLTISVFNGSKFFLLSTRCLGSCTHTRRWTLTWHSTYPAILIRHNDNMDTSSGKQHAFSSCIHIRRLGREPRRLHFDGGIYLLLWKATNSSVIEETYNLCSLIYKGCVPIYCFHNSISVLAYLVAHWVSHCHQHQKYTATI